MSPIVTPVITLRWSKRTGLVKTTEWRQMSWAEFSLNVALAAFVVWVVM